MKNAMKKLLSAVLALVLVIGVCPAAFAAEAETCELTFMLKSSVDASNVGKYEFTANVGEELYVGQIVSSLYGCEVTGYAVNGSVFDADTAIVPYEDTQVQVYVVVKTEVVTPPAETEAPETVPTETEPAETEPVETEPVETEPVVTEPVETEPEIEYVTFWYGPDNTSVKVDVKNGKVTTPAAKFINGYTFLGWLVNGKLVDAGVEIEVDGNNSISAYYEDTDPTATYTLNVYARKYVDGVLKETQLIHTNKKMQKNDKVLEYLSTVKADLRNEVEARFPTCTWSGNFYNYYGDQVATNNILTTNGEKNIYINCYSAEPADILVYVYRSSTKTCSRIIEIDGYEAGEVVTSTAVKNAVKNYYSYNNFYMFDAEGWADFKNDKEDTSTKGVTVKSNGTTKIYVYLTGSSSSSSSSSGVADSSNPKTGDTIFMAVTVMALSATALAAVYVFSKKRAVK